MLQSTIKSGLSRLQFNSIQLFLFVIILTTFNFNLWAQSPWIPDPSSLLPIHNTNNNGNGYVGIGTGTTRTPITKLQLYLPWTTLSYESYNRLSILLEAGISQSFHAVGELAIAKDPYIINYSSIATEGDVVLRAGGITGLENQTEQLDCSEDLVLTTRNANGSLRFATTPTLGVDDKERMTIVPNGHVGLGNNEPKNLFSVQNTTGMDFWNDNIHFQDIRFNCYASDESVVDSPSDTSLGDNFGQMYHHNILGGHSAIIQSKSAAGQGGLIIAVSQNNLTADSRVEFFETIGGPPKGILLQNYLTSTNIGLGSLTEPNTRVKIQGRTSDNTMNALKVVNWNNTSLFTVRNDGLVCAKEIMVQLSGSPCWPDYVFNDDHNLMPLKELEQYVKTQKHLPDIPSSTQVAENGINIGEMQYTLVKKIEELTLYVIQLKKENDEMKNRIIQIDSKINQAGIK